MKVGVLALQGAFGLHERVLNRLGVAAVQVRTPDDLAEVDRLVVPGGESTAISKLLDANGLADPLADRLAGGLPVLGTCAGLILLAAEVVDGYPGQHCFGAVDVAVRRNGYGRQSESFSAPIEVEGWESAFPGVFIRAPVIESAGLEVEVLAELDGVPVLCRQGSAVVSSFHPELAEDDRVHRWFVEQDWSTGHRWFTEQE
ncbi:pyridoxal 5'-phosphate synthase glutaminase subunit PdxT [Candidatus Poriferisocius sp.]|uniref:pyridoxal 5'-phosphate synthase glutaminase subunit PdxT n=1 Tax=Candidatus Poriferisocius sp. TaxID=3101276 RepID=UPI003B0193E6